jgi:hypothetical protein
LLFHRLAFPATSHAYDYTNASRDRKLCKWTVEESCTPRRLLSVLKEDGFSRRRAGRFFVCTQKGKGLLSRQVGERLALRGASSC